MILANSPWRTNDRCDKWVCEIELSIILAEKLYRIFLLLLQGFSVPLNDIFSKLIPFLTLTLWRLFVVVVVVNVCVHPADNNLHFPFQSYRKLCHKWANIELGTTLVRTHTTSNLHKVNNKLINWIEAKSG